MPPSAYSSSEVRAMRRFVVFCVVFCAIVIFGAILPHYRVSHSRRSANVVSAAQLPANWHSDDCSDSSGKPCTDYSQSNNGTTKTGQTYRNTNTNA